MKKIFSICMLAFVALTIASCGKDEDKQDNQPVADKPIADNTLIYDGQSYDMQVAVNYYHQELTKVDAESVQKEGEEPVISVVGIHILPEVWNHSFDIAKHEAPIIFNEMRLGNIIVSEDLAGIASGTYSVDGKNDGTPIIIELDCVLTNGKRVQMKLVSDSYEI